MTKKMIATLLIVVFAMIAGTYVKTSAQNTGSATPQVKTTKQVDLYVTSWCPWCRKMISFLDQKGIQYTVHDVEKEAGAQETLNQRGLRGIPIVIIGDEVIQGYDPAAVMAALR